MEVFHVLYCKNTVPCYYVLYTYTSSHCPLCKNDLNVREKSQVSTLWRFSIRLFKICTIYLHRFTSKKISIQKTVYFSGNGSIDELLLRRISKVTKLTHSFRYKPASTLFFGCEMLDFIQKNALFWRCNLFIWLAHAKYHIVIRAVKFGDDFSSQRTREKVRSYHAMWKLFLLIYWWKHQL